MITLLMVAALSMQAGSDLDREAVDCTKREAVALSIGNTESAETLAKVGIAKCEAEWTKFKELADARALAARLLAQSMGGPLRYPAASVQVEEAREKAIAEAVIGILEARKI